MKTFITIGILSLFLSIAFLFASCQDKVDMGDMYTFSGQTITDYVNEDSTLTLFAKILTKSKVSEKSKNTLDILLSTRGNYTVFAPTDDAVKVYLDSIYGYQPYDLDTMSQTTADKITLNCIIDNGDNDALLSTDFITGALNQTTFNDRYILVYFDTINGGQLAIMLNASSRITMPDIELTNGVLHKVNRVISPSTASLSALLAQTPNTRIFSHILETTGWADSLVAYRDEDYEDIPENILNKRNGPDWQNILPSPEHRYYGFTAFVEPDSVFETEWNIPEPVEVNGSIVNWDEIMTAVAEKCKEAYPDATSDDPESQNNAVNQFISYHLIKGRVPSNMLVNHITELGYYYLYPDQLSIDVWEYYLSMGKWNRMFKITQPAKTGTLNINRHSTYDNSFSGDYHEVSCDREGIEISVTNGAYDINALNGYYYPINHIMVYDDDVPNKVLNERMRYDAMAVMPELMTNGVRHPAYRGPHNVPAMYVDGFTYTNETQGSMISWGEGWVNWQSDELIFYGQVDLTFKLFPVPYDGTYEVRIGCANLGNRVMAQLYFGTDPQNLPATGLPIDFRMSTTSPYIDWISDVGLDEEQCIENDKFMRNKGYMKGPQYCCANNYTHRMDTPLRNYVGALTGLRKVLYQGNLEHDKTYYIRVKSVLESTSNGMDVDYIEVVPKWVYNGTEAEDIW